MKIDIDDKTRFEIEDLVENYDGNCSKSPVTDSINYVKAMDVLKTIKGIIDNQHIVDEQAIEDLIDSIN